MSLLLKKKGVLELTEWEFDEVADKGEYVSRNIEEDGDLLLRLHNPVDLDEGVTLEDVLDLVARHESLFKVLMPGCYVSEYLAAAKLEKTKDTEIEWLELYTSLETDNSEYDDKLPRRLNGLFLAQLHGIGKVLEEDTDYGFKKGERVNYSLSFSPIANLLDLPIKIADKVTISDAIDWNKNATVLDATPQYTLFQIIYGILWEISWHGSPEETQKTGDMVKASADEVMSSKADLSDLE